MGWRRQQEGCIIYSQGQNTGTPRRMKAKRVLMDEVFLDVLCTRQCQIHEGHGKNRWLTRLALLHCLTINNSYLRHMVSQLHCIFRNCLTYGCIPKASIGVKATSILKPRIPIILMPGHTVSAFHHSLQKLTEKFVDRHIRVGVLKRNILYTETNLPAKLENPLKLHFIM